MGETPRPASVAAAEKSAKGAGSEGVRDAALIATLLMIDSLHFVFARLLFPYVEPSLGAFYVMAFAVLEVGILGVAFEKLRLEPLRRLWPVFLAIGICVAASTNLNYAAMAYVDPGVAAMVAKTIVLFSLGFSLFWLRERLNRVQACGAAVAVVGLAVISYKPGNLLDVGTVMILVSTFLYALHAALTKRHIDRTDLLNFFFYRLLFSAAILALINLSRGSLPFPHPLAVPILMLVATLDIVISRFLYYWALRQLDMSVFSVALAASPVAAVLWSWALFDVFPSAQQLLGGAGILAGVALVSAAPFLERKLRRRASG